MKPGCYKLILHLCGASLNNGHACFDVCDRSRCDSKLGKTALNIFDSVSLLLGLHIPHDAPIFIPINHALRLHKADEIGRNQRLRRPLLSHNNNLYLVLARGLAVSVSAGNDKRQHDSENITSKYTYLQ